MTMLAEGAQIDGVQSVVGGLAVDLKKEAWRELRMMEGWAT
jgi:hypothetical protein